jgi:putative PIN family toxin of toxin-antitoxin system
VIIAEYKEVMARPHIRRKYSKAVQVAPAVIEFLEVMAEMVFPTHIESVIVEDPDDDFVLAYALEGEADVIVSGDPHLMSLGKYQDIEILTPREFVVRFLKNQGH